MVLLKKDIILEEREQPKQSEGRKAVQWYNSTIHEVAVTDSTWPGKAASKDRQWKYFLLRFRGGPHFYGGIVSWGRHRKAIQSVLKPLLCSYEHQTQKLALQNVGFWRMQPADMQTHMVGEGAASRALLRVEDFYKFRLVEHFITSVAQLVSLSTETRPTC